MQQCHLWGKFAQSVVTKVMRKPSLDPEKPLQLSQNDSPCACVLNQRVSLCCFSSNEKKRTPRTRPPRQTIRRWVLFCCFDSTSQGSFLDMKQQRQWNQQNTFRILSIEKVFCIWGYRGEIENKSLCTIGIFQAWMMQSHMPVQYKAHDMRCALCFHAFLYRNTAAAARKMKRRISLHIYRQVWRPLNEAILYNIAWIAAGLKKMGQ